jgi:hypothetical protein
MGQIDTITQYVLALVPAVTALMGMIVVVGVGIGKIKNALKGNIESVEKIGDEYRAIKAQNIEIKRQNIELKRQNEELKKAFTNLCNKIEVIDTIKAVNKKE